VKHHRDGENSLAGNKQRARRALTLIDCSVLDPLNQPLIELPPGDLAGAVVANAGVTPITLILPLILSLAISMVIIPLMVRLAPRLGMIDKPDPRKVHAVPIPRVGGVGIVLGALLPVIVLLPFDQSLQAYVFGALVLFGFGVMDDCKELGHYVKFIGQFIAVIAVVYYGDVFVTHFPFMGGEPVSAAVGRPFTVFAMVGMINAINHSDGLDGLAGGESMLSLAGIAYLSYLAGGITVSLIAFATIGGLFGFMRFNTYPARIFMGDGGSQFLGYTLGFLAVLLTQDVNPALSPALPAFLLGLPIADIIGVFAQRVYHRVNWFRATKNHIHHRLLDLGFQHYESVVIVYSVQALLVCCAMLMPYEADALILGIYAAVVAAVFGFLYAAERRGWHRYNADQQASVEGLFHSVGQSTRLRAVAYGVVFFGISLFMVAGAFIATKIPHDFTLAAMVMFVLLLLRLLAGFHLSFVSLRLLVYVAIVFIVYLSNTYQPAYLSGTDPVTYAIFGMLVAGIALTIRDPHVGRFSVTPMDFLVVLAVLALAVMASAGMVDTNMTSVALKTIILFYGAELILGSMKQRWNLFTVSVLAALLVICVRGMIENFV
jgi:UDP-GlcNAc:undecaprenyl-phosphate GlcNAc-1-phosphate transferase